MAELAEQVKTGHIDPLPLKSVSHLYCLSIYLISEIPQKGHNQHLIYDFSWSGLNTREKQYPPKEEMGFGKSLFWLINFILAEDTNLVPTLLNKVYLSDSYMRI